MNTYSQTKVNGNAMPFIMGCTRPSPIEAMEDDEKVIYDPMTQSTIVNMRTVGTKSIKSEFTGYSKGSSCGTMDRKNYIDDSKSVK